MKLTILMPCLNEEKTIGYCVDEAMSFLEKNHILGEVIIADNNSTDSSREIAMQHGAHVVTIMEKGYGNAIRGGIKRAKGKYIIMGDCDGSYNFSMLEEFIHYLESGYDLVVGNRFLGKLEHGAMKPLHRYIGVPILSWIGRKVYHTNSIKDFHCGLRGFRREVAIALHLQAQGMEFASEIIGEFAKANKSMIEIPIDFRKDQRERPSHLHPVRDGVRHLKWMICTRKK